MNTDQVYVKVYTRDDTTRVKGDLLDMDIMVMHPNGAVLNIQPLPNGFDVSITNGKASAERIPGTGDYPVVHFKLSEARP